MHRPEACCGEEEDEAEAIANHHGMSKSGMVDEGDETITRRLKELDGQADAERASESPVGKMRP